MSRVAGGLLSAILVFAPVGCEKAADVTFGRHMDETDRQYADRLEMESYQKKFSTPGRTDEMVAADTLNAFFNANKRLPDLQHPNDQPSPESENN
jgi:hypothetical protein